MVSTGLTARFARRRADGALVKPLSFALLPTPFPAAAFHAAWDAQLHFNALYARLRTDASFLTATLAAVAEADPFVQRLLDVHATVQREGVRQPLSLAVHRADYMLHQPDADGPIALQQVGVACTCVPVPAAHVHGAACRARRPG